MGLLDFIKGSEDGQKKGGKGNNQSQFNPGNITAPGGGQFIPPTTTASAAASGNTNPQTPGVTQSAPGQFDIGGQIDMNQFSSGSSSQPEFSSGSLFGGENQASVSNEQPVAQTQSDPLDMNIDNNALNNGVGQDTSLMQNSNFDALNDVTFNENDQPTFGGGEVTSQEAVSNQQAPTGPTDPFQVNNPLVNLPKFDIPDLSNMPGMNNQPMQEPAEQVAVEAPDSTPEQAPVVQNMPTEQVVQPVPEPVASPIVENQAPIQTPEIEQFDATAEQPEAAPVPEKAIESQPMVSKKPKRKAGMKMKDKFRKVALVGLEGNNLDPNFGNAVNNFVKQLYSQGMEVVLDSKEGLGEFALKGATESQASAMGIYLKPYLSSEDHSEEGDAKLGAGASVLYSNYFEWLRHLVKEGRMFIVFDTGGIGTLALLLNLLNISKMYKGKHKPIILFGDSWNGKIATLKNQLGASDIDDETFMVVSDSDQALQKISEIKLEYKVESSDNIQKIVDRRVEGDERDFLIT